MQSRYELFAKDVTKHCTTLQLKGVFRPFLSTSQARLVEVIGSPVFLRLVDRGVSKFAAAAAIAVTQVDTANEESVDLANAWLECSVDSPSAWSIGCRSLWQANAVDTSKYDLSTPVAHGRSLPTISQCRGGVWAPDPLGFLHSSRSDVLTRLLIWHGPSKVVMPGVVMDYVSEPNPDLHWGHFILFDNGDLRWYVYSFMRCPLFVLNVRITLHIGFLHPLCLGTGTLC